MAKPHISPSPQTQPWSPTQRDSGSRATSKRVAVEEVYVSEHALGRLRQHHPSVGIRGTLALLMAATEIEPGMAAAFLGRSLEAVRDRYFLSADRRGIFTLARSFEGRGFKWVIITYLRFGQYQQEVAERLLGAA